MAQSQSQSQSQQNQRNIREQCSKSQYFLGISTAAELSDSPFPWSASPVAMAEIWRWMARANFSADVPACGCADLFRIFNIHDESDVYPWNVKELLQQDLLNRLLEELEFFKLPEVGVVDGQGRWVPRVVQQWDRRCWDPAKCHELVHLNQMNAEERRQAQARQDVREAQAAAQALEQDMMAAIDAQTRLWGRLPGSLRQRVPDFAQTSVAEAGPPIQALLSTIDGLSCEVAAQAKDATHAIAMWAVAVARVESLKGDMERSNM
ncbi:hypothetical protein IWX47DRAFT_884578 [Phyllosticta citricarpa]